MGWNMEWLLFLPQLPASPSTLRVTTWRRLRAAGALGLQNGVWMLPSTPENRKFAEGQMAYIKEQGATSYAFDVVLLDPSMEENILADFRSERDEEYAEFCERCGGFLAELDKGTSSEKFTFAELEENEQDLNKLSNWLQKIQARDFFTGAQAEAAVQALSACQQSFEKFTQAVHAQAGLNKENRNPPPRE
jgi:hypothetical protein